MTTVRQTPSAWLTQRLESIFSATDAAGEQRKQPKRADQTHGGISRRGELELYRRPDSFADLLHFAHYDPESEIFMYPDREGLICGALIEVQPADAEGRSKEYLINLRERIADAIAYLPEHDHHPWVLQIYVQDEPIVALSTRIRHYLKTVGKPSAFQDVFIEILEKHLETMTRRGGLFRDQRTGSRWGARYRRVRCVLYRTYSNRRRTRADNALEYEVNDIVERFRSGLQNAGIKTRRGKGADMVAWMLPWLSPDPDGFEDAYEYLRKVPYDLTQDDPNTTDRLLSHDLAELVLRKAPRSGTEASGAWWFGSEVHRIISIDRMSRVPGIGHFTLHDREKLQSAVLMDQLPEGSIISMTVVIAPQDEIAFQIGVAGKASIGDSAAARHTERDAQEALLALDGDNKAFPTWINVLIRAQDERTLNQYTTRANSVLSSAGLVPIEPSADLVSLASLPLSLPMGYKPSREKRLMRSRLQWDKHIANMMPLYGAGVGSSNPGMLFLNSSGGPLMVDPLNQADREMSAHSLILGPTGAGKSALIVYLCNWLMAVHKPHLVIIDVGGSFKLLGDFLAANGFSVNHVKLNPTSDVSLPPFRDAVQLLDRVDADDVDEESRDLLAEMAIAARYMITHGRREEEARLHAEDERTVRHAIMLAAAHTVEARRRQTMVNDVVWALRALSEGAAFYGQAVGLAPERRTRAGEMADAMDVYCSGANARYFNREGEGFPERDVTIVDLDQLARAEKADALIIVFMGLMNTITSDIERRRASGRPTVVINDEANVTTSRPLLADYVVQASKMWRKYGTWLWMATQNLADFPDKSAKILNMAEFWFCLSMPPDEVDQIARFKKLTADDRSLLLAARKEPGKFVEGVLLSKKPATLFRNIPPAICLALAQTEQHEVAARAKLMQEHGITELEAAMLIADELDHKRWGQQRRSSL